MTSNSNDTQVSGNTIPSTLILRARAFQFTIHQLPKYEPIVNHFLNLKSCDYGISCEEICPKTEKKHIHLYVHFSSPYRIPAKILAYNQHIEICRGSPKQNIEYIRKDGKILDTWGEEPHQGKAYTVKELKECPIDEVPANLYRIKKELEQEAANDFCIDDSYKDIKVTYIQGPSGCGKTQLAKQMIRETGETICNILKYENGFYSGIGNAKVALYDDFRDTHMPASEFINLIDYNKHNMNIKGGYRLNNYTTIIITSVQRIEDIYKRMSNEPRQQWMRRVKVIDMYEPSVDDIALT